MQMHRHQAAHATPPVWNPAARTHRVSFPYCAVHSFNLPICCYWWCRLFQSVARQPPPDQGRGERLPAASRRLLHSPLNQPQCTLSSIKSRSSCIRFEWLAPYCTEPAARRPRPTCPARRQGAPRSAPSLLQLVSHRDRTIQPTCKHRNASCRVSSMSEETPQPSGPSVVIDLSKGVNHGAPPEMPEQLGRPPCAAAARRPRRCCPRRLLPLGAELRSSQAQPADLNRLNRLAEHRHLNTAQLHCPCSHPTVPQTSPRLPWRARCAPAAQAAMPPAWERLSRSMHPLTGACWWEVGHRDAPAGLTRRRACAQLIQLTCS